MGIGGAALLGEVTRPSVAGGHYICGENYHLDGLFCAKNFPLVAACQASGRSYANLGLVPSRAGPTMKPPSEGALPVGGRFEPRRRNREMSNMVLS